MKNKGFTLIELLAVIIILSVIALISIPVILNVVEKVQKAAYKESLRSVFAATELYLATNEFIDFPAEGIDITDSGIEIKNKDFISGKIAKNDQGEFVLNKVTNGIYCGSGTIDNLIIIEGICDDEVPIITVTPLTVDIQTGNEYVDIGVSAIDNIDGDITENIIVTGSVDTSIEGTYILTYNVSDLSGNAAVSVSRTVNVVTNLPTVSTEQITNLAETSVTISGEVTDDGGGTITERGIVYDTNPNPIITGAKIIVSGTTGTFSGNIIGLTGNTIYHARVYAINSVGTSYGSDITFTTGIGGIDEYAKLMLHMDGIDNGTTFTDETGKTVNRVGDTVTKISEKKLGNASSYFDGNDDYLSIPYSSDWNFSNGNFTIDLWVNFSEANLTTSYYFIGQYVDSNNYWYLRKNDDSNRKWRFMVMSSGSQILNVMGGSDSTNPVVGLWNHIALVRNGSIFTIYKNGNSVASTSSSITIPNYNAPLVVGNYGSPTSTFNGYIDEVRVSKGIARWTSNFTPPTRPYSP